jgi:membrane-bound serine protease (ClpP class)
VPWQGRGGEVAVRAHLGLVWRLGAVIAALWVGLLTQPAAAASPVVLSTRVDGIITPVVAAHLVDGVRKAEDEGAAAYLVELDTPGGLDTSMREIVKSFLGARVPVIVYVTPSGSRAASAGALIAFSAHVVAMAPGTTIGAATPVDLQGGKISDKIINDAAAYAKSVATQRGRNVTFAEDTVRKGRAVTAEEAVKLHAVDLIAADRSALLAEVDGRVVRGPSGEITIRTAGAHVVEHNLGLFRRLLQLIADPNLAFLFLSIGTLAVIYELASPGVGVAGAAGVILLILGFFALSVLPVNVAGLGLLALAAVLFTSEVFAPHGAFAAGGTAALLLSGLFLFEGSIGVSLTVLLPTTLLIGGGTLAAGRLAWRARRATPVTGDGALVGVLANVDRVVADGRGVAMVEGAWWNLRTRGGELHAGQPVRVVGREDLDLVVEPIQPAEEET